MIHKTAIIESGANIASDVQIGPYCIIGKDVVIGEGTTLESHVVITGKTTVGKNNKFSPFASIGQPPQDLKYKGEQTAVVIGDRNIIREYVTINCGTSNGKGVTTIGNENMIMAYGHVAHDCVVNDHVVMANNASLAGHVVLEDYVVLGGFTGVTQFNRVGKHAFIGAHALIRADFPPYFTGKGLDEFRVQSVNSVGLQRRGFSEDSIRKIKNAYKVLYLRKDVTLEDAINIISEDAQGCEDVLYLIDFIKKSKNGIVR